jgi:hypothetical protein
MKCSGKCYCGNFCTLDHEKVAQRCDCVNNHFFCKEKCNKHSNTNCVFIARHRGSHDCLECIKLTPPAVNVA